MREHFRLFFHDRVLTSLFLSAVLGNSATIVFLLWRLAPSDQPIPLHYNIYFGIDAIGPWYAYYYLPAGSMIFLLMNTGISLWLVKHERVLARLNLVIANVVALLILISVVTAVQTLL